MENFKFRHVVALVLTTAMTLWLFSIGALAHTSWQVAQNQAEQTHSTTSDTLVRNVLVQTDSYHSEPDQQID